MAQVPVSQRGSGGQMTRQGEHPIQRLHQDLDMLFNRLWGGWMSPLDQDFAGTRLWDFDVTENDNEITVRAEIPGFEENELDVQLANDVLTIKAEKEQRGEGREEYRSFYRSVTLPGGIDAEKVQASYRNGVLEMHIPRAAGAQPKRIKLAGSQKAGNGRESITQAGTTANEGISAKKQSGEAAKDKGKS